MMPEKPKKDFVELLKHVSYEIEHIDESTPALRTVEPDWWVDMMEIQRKIVECKMKYIEYEV